MSWKFITPAPQTWTWRSTLTKRCHLTRFGSFSRVWSSFIPHTSPPAGHHRSLHQRKRWQTNWPSVRIFISPTLELFSVRQWDSRTSVQPSDWLRDSWHWNLQQIKKVWRWNDNKFLYKRKSYQPIWDFFTDLSDSALKAHQWFNGNKNKQQSNVTGKWEKRVWQ